MRLHWCRPCRSCCSGWSGVLLWLLLILAAETTLFQHSNAFLLPTPPRITAKHQHIHAQLNRFDDYKRVVLHGSIITLQSSKQPQVDASKEQPSTKATAATTTTTKTTPSTTKKRRTWNENFQLLVEFKEKNGHSNVPDRFQDDPTLGGWVGRQRTKGQKDQVLDEQRSKLDDLGFAWSIFPTWDQNLELLLSYKNKHGNCNVPSNYEEDPSLGKWVISQRQRKDRLSDEQREKLDDLNFAWSKELLEAQWDEMFKCLQVYAEANDGDCNIPTSIKRTDANFALSLWVRDQRKRKSLLSTEQRSKLDDLGLTWEDADKEKLDRKWNAMYQRLIEYKREHGDCRMKSLPLDNGSATSVHCTDKGFCQRID